MSDGTRRIFERMILALANLSPAEIEALEAMALIPEFAGPAPELCSWLRRLLTAERGRRAGEMPTPPNIDLQWLTDNQAADHMFVAVAMHDAYPDSRLTDVLLPALILTTAECAVRLKLRDTIRSN